MPARTQLIFTDQPGALPASYRVPPSLEIVAASVFARFDGTGASGDFVPTLDILSQSGQLMARVAVSQTLSAGDLARVTWAPFLRMQQASTPPPPSGSVIELGADTEVTTTSGAGLTQIVLTGFGGPNSGAYFDVDGSGQMRILDKGVYGFHMSAGGMVLPANVDSTLLYEVRRISGTTGTWSSQGGLVAPVVGAATWAERINQAGTGIDVNAEGQSGFTAFASWISTNTFPAIFQFKVDRQENNASVAKSVTTKLVVVRFGDPYE